MGAGAFQNMIREACFILLFGKLILEVAMKTNVKFGNVTYCQEKSRLIIGCGRIIVEKA